MHPLHGSPHLVHYHFGLGITLRALVPAAGTAYGDVVLSVPQHPVPAEAVFQPGLGPVYPLVSHCWDVMAQPYTYKLRLPSRIWVRNAPPGVPAPRSSASWAMSDCAGPASLLNISHGDLTNTGLVDHRLHSRAGFGLFATRNSLRYLGCDI